MNYTHLFPIDENKTATPQITLQHNNAHSYEKYGNNVSGINATFNVVRLRVAIIEFTP